MSFRIGLFIGVALFSVSTSSLVVRYLVDVPAVVIAFWRMMTASILLWAYSYHSKDILSPVNRKRVSVSGVFLGLHFAFFFGSVKLTSVANATILGTLAPLFTLFIERFLYRRHFNTSILVGLFFSLLGAFIIQDGSFSLNDEKVVGNVLAILGSFCIAISWIVAEKIRKSSSAITYSRTVFLVAALVLFLLATIRNESVLSFDINHFGWFLFLGLVPTIFGHVILSFILKYVNPTTVASIPLGEPFVASGLAFIIFQEAIPLATYVGGFITLVGLFIIIKERVSRISS